MMRDGMRNDFKKEIMASNVLTITISERVSLRTIIQKK